jgi:hypothetical protein
MAASTRRMPQGAAPPRVRTPNGTQHPGRKLYAESQSSYADCPEIRIESERIIGSRPGAGVNDDPRKTRPPTGWRLRVCGTRLRESSVMHRKTTTEATGWWSKSFFGVIRNQIRDTCPRTDARQV